MTNKHTYKAFIYPILATFCWAFSYVWTKMAFVSFLPITLVTLRVIIASVFMLILALSLRQLQKVHRKHIWWFLGLGLLEPFGYFLCEVYGLTMVSPTFAAVMLAMIPLTTPFIAYLFINERFTYMNIAGIIVSLAGVIAISVNKNWELTAEPTGIILLTAAIFISISYSMSVKKLTTHYTVLSIVTYQNIIGILYFVPLYFLTDFGNNTLPFKWDAFEAVIYLSIFSSALAFVFYAKALVEFGVTRTNLFLNLLPAITAFLSVKFLGEELTTQKMIGIGVVVLGLFVGQIQLQKKRYAN